MRNNNNIAVDVQGTETAQKTINMMFPTSLVKKIEKLFEGDKTDFKKVLFTVFWINKGKYNSIKKRYEAYQEVSSRYGNWMALTGKKGTEFIAKLVDGGIIKKVSGYTTAKHYTRYTLVTPYLYKGKDATGNDYTLYTLTEDSGAFAKKYIKDNYNVIIPSTSTKVKVKEIAKKMNVEVLQVGKDLEKNNMDLEKEKITQLEFKVSILEELIASMQQQINELVNNSVNHVVAQPSTEIVEEVKNNEYFEPQYVYDSEGNMVSSSQDVYASTLIERKKIKGADTPFFPNEDNDNNVDIYNAEAFIVPDTNNEIVFNNNDVQQVEIKEVKQVEEVTVSEKEATATRICGRHIKDTKTKKEIVKSYLNNNNISVQEIVNKGISGATATRLYNELLQAI